MQLDLNGPMDRKVFFLIFVPKTNKLDIETRSSSFKTNRLDLRNNRNQFKLGLGLLENEITAKYLDKVLPKLPFLGLLLPQAAQLRLIFPPLLLLLLNAPTLNIFIKPGSHEKGLEVAGIESKTSQSRADSPYL